MESNRGLVHFCHGKESGPWGGKIRRLAAVATDLGYKVESLDYSGLDSPQARVERLLQHQSPVENLILAGSSMGGYVATVASKTLSPKGLFLLAPAISIPGYDRDDLIPKARLIEIVHGWDDEIIPPENSFRFAKTHKAHLHLIDSDHRLNEQVDLLAALFESFLQRVEIISQG
jgi:alpha/beta superfamily hydrolase